MENIDQALLYLGKEIKWHRSIGLNYNMDSSNMGICTIVDIGEVVYIRLPSIGDRDNEVEIIKFTDGEDETGGSIGIDRPFTSPGIYKDTLSGHPYIIQKIKPIDKLEEKLAKLRLLGDI